VSILFQNRQELVNQSIHEINKLMELWEKRITIDNLRFADRFRAGELSVIVHFRGAVDASEVWAAEFVSKKWDHAHPSPDPIGPAKNILADRQNQPVLPNIVEFVDFPERISAVLVGLARIEDFHRVRADSLYFSSLGRFIAGHVIANRKAASFENISGGIGRVDIYKLVNQVIQCRTQIVDDIGGGTEGIESGSNGFVSIDESVRNIRVFMGDSHVLVELFEMGLHVFEVLLGPFNFRPYKS